MKIRIINRFLAALAALGALLPADGVLASAPGRVDDSTRALSEEVKAALQREVEDFSRETGVPLLVKAVAYVEPGVSLREATRAARREFAAQGPVALIMIDRGKNSIGISHSPELWQRYPLARLVETLRAAVNGANATPRAPLEEKLTATCRRWMADVRELENERRLAARALQGRDKPVLLVFGSLVGLGGLGALVLASRGRARQATGSERYRFPDIAVGQRLGAPYGGGHIAECEAGQREA